MRKAKTGKAAAGIKKLNLPPLRKIEIYPAAENGAVGGEPCCYEYQLEKGGTRVFLRSRTAYATAVPARLLATPAGALLSVDDLLWQKQAIRRHHREIDLRYRPAGFLRRNRWWLLAFALLICGDFLHVAAHPASPDWLTPPYVVTGVLLLALWLWHRWPESSGARKAGEPAAGSETLGETTPLADNLPDTRFGEPDAGARQRLSLDFAEGCVGEVRYTYFDLPCEEYDPSVVVLEFLLRQGDGRLLSCRYEVRKHAPLFFVSDGDAVRLLGWRGDGKMTVQHAANLADGHVCSSFSPVFPLPLPPADKRSGRFFLRVIGESVAFALALVAAVLALGFVMLWGADLLLGYASTFRTMLEDFGYFSAAALGLAALIGAGNGVRKAWHAKNLASALGLLTAQELVVRQRVVCNQGNCL